MADPGANTMDVQVGLLGEVEVRFDGRLLTIGHARQQCVLAALMIDVNRPVSVDELIERVWADRPARHARRALYNYVSRLRQILAETGMTIALRSGGYVVELDPTAVDLHRFRELSARARAVTERQDGAVLFHEALDLWRGRAFGTLDTPWLNGIRAGLETERSAVYLDWGDVELLLGRHAELVSDLSARHDAEPLDERLTGQLLLALYRSGRQSEALTRYQELRRRLAEELGVDPGPALQDLHQQILTRDPTLAAPVHRPAPVSRLAPVASQASWPIVVGEPPLVSTAFQPRPGVRRRLTAAMRRAGSTTVIMQVLSGDGGIGKTQIAAAIFDEARCERATDLLVWLTATSTDAVITGYAQALARVVPGTSIDDPRDSAFRFLTWLRETDRAWLIVLDDVADPEHLSEWWPTGPHGRTLVTTRRRDSVLSEQRRVVIDMGVYEPEESQQYLATRLDVPGTRSDVMHGSADLAGDLGHLPLALAQAGAVILDAGLTCEGYRVRLQERSLSLIHLFPQPLDHRQQTVAGTWALATAAANSLAPVGIAGPLLDLIAVLDPNGIPEDVLMSGAAAEYVADRCPEAEDIRQRSASERADDLRQALRNLHRLSLITHDPADAVRTIRMHALAQRAAREGLEEMTLRAAFRTAADALASTWPVIDRDGRLSAVLRSNAAVLTEQAADTLWGPGAHALLLRAGRSRTEAGLFLEAVGYWQQLAATSAEKLGSEHPDTLSVRAHLANSRGRSGDRVAALSEFQELAAVVARVSGPDHPATLTARGDLARWQARAGDPIGAVSALEKLLTDRTRVLGADHPDTLRTRSGLAFSRAQAGDPPGALAAYEELVPEVMRVLGPDDPDVLTIRDHLARWRAATGNPGAALAESRHLLADRLRVLGPHHPDTLAARGHLAYWRGECGDPGGAVIAIEELVVDIVQLLGPDHPGALAARSNLAYWRGRAGDLAAAATATQKVLEDRVRVLGPDHPDTLTTKGHLGKWRGASGDLAGAVAILQDLLADQLRVFGPEHRETLATQRHLVDWKDQATRHPSRR